jgi:hypothetical protein
MAALYMYEGCLRIEDVTRVRRDNDVVGRLGNGLEDALRSRDVQTALRLIDEE